MGEILIRYFGKKKNKIVVSVVVTNIGADA